MEHPGDGDESKLGGANNVCDADADPPPLDELNERVSDLEDLIAELTLRSHSAVKPVNPNPGTDSESSSSDNAQAVATARTSDSKVENGKKVKIGETVSSSLSTAQLYKRVVALEVLTTNIMAADPALQRLSANRDTSVSTTHLPPDILPSASMKVPASLGRSLRTTRSRGLPPSTVNQGRLRFDLSWTTPTSNEGKSTAKLHHSSTSKDLVSTDILRQFLQGLGVMVRMKDGGPVDGILPETVPKEELDRFLRLEPNSDPDATSPVYNWPDSLSTCLWNARLTEMLAQKFLDDISSGRITFGGQPVTIDPKVHTVDALRKTITERLRNTRKLWRKANE